MILYTVRPGDTLRRIARRFSCGVQELCALNALSDPERLVPGLALAIPTAESAPLAARVVNAYAFPSVCAADLTEQLRYFSFFCPFSCAVTAKGELGLSLENRRLIEAASKAGAAVLLCVTNIDETGSYCAELAHALLSDSAVQDLLLSRLLACLDSLRCCGVNFSFQYLFPFDREAYSAFLRRASERLHRAGALVTTAVAPQESELQGGFLCAAQDYAVHADCADWVILLSYDWGYVYSAPQAISPVDRIRRALDHALVTIPREKLLLGMSNYACDWALPWREGQAARLLSNSAAVNLAISRGAEIEYEPRAAAPHFRYTDAAHIRRELWFEDVRSVRARLALVNEYDLGGISYWTVNFPNPPMLLAQRESFAVLRP